MKLKCKPDDFIVDEITKREASDGSFALYRLSKQSIGTPEALTRVRRTRNLHPNQVSHGGLKDRHAVTSQFITIRNGPRNDIECGAVNLAYLGQTPKPFSAADIEGNRFRIVLRSLSGDEVRRISDRLNPVSERGFPNYFDSQRFGSLGASEEFIAAAWCRRNYERALWLALADHNGHDDAGERAEKRILREHWNDWVLCKQRLSRSHRRSIVTYLVDHPQGFRKAFALLNSDLRGIWLSAFQSAVWNRMLAQMITTESPAAEHVGDALLPFPSCPQPVVARETLPLPSARCKSLADDVGRICDTALQPYGMTLPEMKLSFPRDRWFSRGHRATFVRPIDLAHEFSDDDLHSGKQKAVLAFDLPRGSYATMLIKTLLAGPYTMIEDRSETEAEEQIHQRPAGN